MSDLNIRRTGVAGRVTFTRPKAMNALSPAMSIALEQALVAWSNDPSVSVVVIDAEGDRAFCAGGDLSEIYHAGCAGDHRFAQDFWRQEYRLNALIARFPKPVVTFLNGFVMGGGVGVGCHASHRIVCDSTRIAMPECGIGLVPDVGGTWLLAQGAGAVGAYLALTSTRMGPGDAIYVGFADTYVPQSRWPDLIQRLEQSGDVSEIGKVSAAHPDAPLQASQAEIDDLFGRAALGDIQQAVATRGTDLAGRATKAMARNAPLAMACALALVRQTRSLETLEQALAHEFRCTFRSLTQGDFLEGIRALIIDKDNAPRWSPSSAAEIDPTQVAAMMAPLGVNELHLNGGPVL